MFGGAARHGLPPKPSAFTQGPAIPRFRGTAARFDGDPAVDEHSWIESNDRVRAIVGTR
ncbi:hypothetical protein FRAAL5585 [Frankia alni ACN14a]|uniref:Uncharacterized protein n=1 Tax=Frankia alni (strain DSM 45986 / CECT 9034 / ACN14a) TaxID=326424 RepID=Q0RE93_FRAAA|nr:hypothetical protein FRAAL5585 [Frankia alni ACN14a]